MDAHSLRNASPTSTNIRFFRKERKAPLGPPRGRDVFGARMEERVWRIEKCSIPSYNSISLLIYLYKTQNNNGNHSPLSWRGAGVRLFIMNYKISISERTLHFKQPAGTSRGVYNTRRSWFITITDADQPGRKGIGECAPLPDLSCDAMPEYGAKLREICDRFERDGTIDYNLLRPYPSMLFGLETAILNLNACSPRLYDTPFSRGEVGIPINGLVWMGNFDEMLSRLDEKIKLGFRCVKLKIGAIDFDKELALIRRIRDTFSRKDIELRVDANGGFAPDEALDKLERLARYDIHSIEQPIKQHQWQEMARLCSASPIPIALDEELIGVNEPTKKAALLDTIRPSYVILKPSLHGGMRGSEEWISLARERGIGSWITSALESNVGLNAIAQFTAHIYGPDITMPQGLGTGLLFTDNIPMPLEIRRDELWTERKEYGK